MAALGLVAIRPASGYEPVAFAHRSIACFWSIPRSQLYDELARLEEFGLIAGTHVPQTSAPDKRVYEITEAGRTVLTAWVESSTLPSDRSKSQSTGAMLAGGGGRVDAWHGFPALRQVVLDCTDARALAEFYRQLLGLRYRPGDEPPADGEPDPLGRDWLVLQDAADGTRVAFQQVAELPEATWPDGPHPQMLHLDLTVPSTADLEAQHARALTLGARLLHDRSHDPEEPLRVYADPAGHPFCIFVVATAVK